jgi:hypothetical protein
MHLSIQQTSGTAPKDPEALGSSSAVEGKAEEEAAWASQL